MKRKKYSNDNRLTVQLSDKQYKKILDLSTKISCSKVDVIRYLLSGSNLSQHDLNVLKRDTNKLTDILEKYYINFCKIGNNFNQAIRNQNIAFKYGHYTSLTPRNITKIGNSINRLNKKMTNYSRILESDMHGN